MSLKISYFYINAQIPSYISILIVSLNNKKVSFTNLTYFNNYKTVIHRPLTEEISNDHFVFRNLVILLNCPDITKQLPIQHPLDVFASS